MERLQHHHELGGRTVGIGDNPLLAPAIKVSGIDLRHHERHCLVIAPAGGIIDDDGALRRDLWRPFLRHARASRHQADIGAGEIEMLKRLALQDLVAIGHINAHGAARGERYHFAHRKLALGEDIEHFAADISRGPDNCNLERHGMILCCLLPGNCPRGGGRPLYPAGRGPGTSGNYAVATTGVFAVFMLCLRRSNGNARTFIVDTLI